MRFALDNTVSVMEVLSSRPSSTTEETQSGVPLAIQLHNFERKVLHDSLVRHQGRIADVMVELDLPRRTLNQKMQKFGLNRSDYT
jgi:two-component system C4-dicarboxylate transport response regulator DctD